MPIDLGQVNQLETAELCLYGITLEYALTVLSDILLGVQNITLRTSYLPLEPYRCALAAYYESKLIMKFLSDSLVSSDALMLDNIDSFPS